MISLQFITHQTERYSYFDSACLALEGGCKWIQLRMKEASVEEIEAVATRLKPICKEQGAILVLDDQVELTQKLELDGVHLGKTDTPIGEARRILGEAFIIGGTANTFEDVLSHYRAGADYVGIGPFRFTTTKKNLSPVLGLEGYASILAQMKEKEIELPTVAIGGITYNDITSILQTGIQGIALSSAILNAENPKIEIEKILAINMTEKE